MSLEIPTLSLVVLIGPSGSGKSSFARKHFLKTEVLSSDYFRGLVSDDENNQAATSDAFEMLHAVAAVRLRRGLLTVIDATNVQPESRRSLIQMAKKYHCLPVAIVLDLPESICHARNRERVDRNFGPHVVRQQRGQLRRSLRDLKKEGFRYVHTLRSVEEVDAASIERVPLWNDRKREHGPFDVIGDLHGCCDELEELLVRLGYVYQPRTRGRTSTLYLPMAYVHPEGRQVVFVGDLVDRGPRVLDTLRLVATMTEEGSGWCVPGNHDMKLVKKLMGKDVKVTHGLAETLAEFELLPEVERENLVRELIPFLDGLVSHYVFDDGKLVVAHAGMKEEYQGRGSGRIREFALYGETTGETDEFGLPVRLNWASEYRGQAAVVYGHTPVPEWEWVNGTVNIDTGCVFGGKLTALRYPEREFVSVPAKRTYCEPARPFLRDDPRLIRISAQHAVDDLLDADDVLGKRIIATRLQSTVTIREENATAALEVMSRFAVNPKWLIYLPPTMSPCETSNEPEMLEHPAEAFAYYRDQGVTHVMCQEKHMGSRAIVVVCRDDTTARERFGVLQGNAGVIYTRTGRSFFNDPELERQLLDRLRAALTASGFWDEFESQWACFDCELMPWSAKAQELLRGQYAAVGAAGRASIPKALTALEHASERLTGDEREKAIAMQNRFARHSRSIDRFVAAYRRYCWNVTSIEDWKLAPFHLLATEQGVPIDRTHRWHMNTLAEICSHAPGVLLATDRLEVDLTVADQVDAGIAWWQERTASGGEGMVIKPSEWVIRGSQGLVQPAVKCRGKEYLRIIYGPEYDAPENLERLRRRGLARKRSLAIREFALGIEALERFVRREPLRRVHECVFGVLALESEPVDPRL